MRIFGQIIGFAAMGVSVIIYLQKERKQILALKLLTDVLWAAHHLLIGNITASVTTGISILREALFIKKRYSVFLVIFPVMFFATLFFTYKNITSIIPPIASTLATLAFWNKKVNLIKLFSALVSVLMLTYAIFNSSYATVVNEILVLTSITASMLKSDIKKCRVRKERKTENVDG